MKGLSLLYRILVSLLVLLTPSVFLSCDNDSTDEPDNNSSKYKQTVLMYMPWSGGSIYSYFLQNISSFETAIRNNKGFDGNALVVFISESETKSHLINIKYNDGECYRDTIRSFYFDECDYTTSAGIASVINNAIKIAPAKTYALAIGSHGMGWLPVGSEISTRARMSASENQNVYLTRYFGHSSDNEYQTDISTLADGIKKTGLRMEYIMFDDCYMSNIETAYELKDVTDYLIASTCEIMIDGMPYSEIGMDLLKNNYKNICDGFYSFYSNYSMPCGTIGVTDCNEVERMAEIMKEINTAYPLGVESVDDIQDLDGYNTTVFFDFGDYVSDLCKDEYLLNLFKTQLDRLVPYKANTETYYSMLTQQQTRIKTFSGLTVSDPTENKGLTDALSTTSWYKATH